MMSCSISPTDFTITTAVVAETNTTILTIIEEHFNTLIAMKYNGNYQTHRKLGQRCTGQVWCPSNFKQVWAITPPIFVPCFHGTALSPDPISHGDRDIPPSLYSTHMSRGLRLLGYLAPLFHQPHVSSHTPIG